jgi:hypothetical protein
MTNICKFAFVLTFCLFTFVSVSHVEAWWSYDGDAVLEEMSSHFCLDLGNTPASPEPAGSEDTGLHNTVALAVAATPGGLVPCGDAGQPACEFCHVASLLDNVFQWLAMVLTILATLIIVVSGTWMAVSVGNAQVMKSAKKLITNALTALVIVLGAWILIDLLLQSLLISSFTITAPWYAITCD